MKFLSFQILKIIWGKMNLIWFLSFLLLNYKETTSFNLTKIIQRRSWTDITLVKKVSLIFQGYTPVTCRTLCNNMGNECSTYCHYDTNCYILSLAIVAYEGEFVNPSGFLIGCYSNHLKQLFKLSAFTSKSGIDTTVADLYTSFDGIHLFTNNKECAKTNPDVDPWIAFNIGQNIDSNWNIIYIHFFSVPASIELYLLGSLPANGSTFVPNPVDRLSLVSATELNAKPKVGKEIFSPSTSQTGSVLYLYRSGSNVIVPLCLLNIELK